jgi:hypothetical protein
MATSRKTMAAESKRGPATGPGMRREKMLLGKPRVRSKTVATRPWRPIFIVLVPADVFKLLAPADAAGRGKYEGFDD